MDKQQLEADRHYSVVKSNKLIQQSRHSLSTTEQKIILYLLTKIKPKDNDLKIYDFQIRDFCSVCGISNSGTNYTDLKAAIKKLADKSFWVKTDNGEETLVRWIEKPYIEPHSGTMRIKLDVEMRPYLLGLKTKFTQYEIYYVLAMKSQYSIRVYELLKSYEFERNKKWEITEFKKLVGAEKYQRHADFTRKVLDIAFREINELGDIRIDYTLEKVSRTYKFITFLINSKEDIEERRKTWANIEGKLMPIHEQIKLSY